jgi:hypothetical protein
LIKRKSLKLPLPHAKLGMFVPVLFHKFEPTRFKEYMPVSTDPAPHSVLQDIGLNAPFSILRILLLSRVMSIKMVLSVIVLSIKKIGFEDCVRSLVEELIPAAK